MPADDTFSTLQMADITGATFRQIDYWTRNGVLAPAVPASGSGTTRRFAAGQLLAVRVCLVLARLGAQRDVLAAAVAWFDARPDADGLVVVTTEGAVSAVTSVADMATGWVVDLSAQRAWLGRRIPAPSETVPLA